MISLKNIILVKNLDNKEKASNIEEALAETRVDYEVNIDKQCVIIFGNNDMVAVARNVISGLGYMIL